MDIYTPQNFYAFYCEVKGQEPQTTFWQDFSIADKFGIDAIKDTYNNALNGWHDDIDYLCELAIVLSWKSNEYYDKGNAAYNNLYADLHYQLRDYVLDNMPDADKVKFIDFID